MKEKLIEQAGKELKLAAWVDLIIMVVAVVVTLHLGALAAMTAGLSAESISNPLSGAIPGLAAAAKASFHVTPFIIMVAGLAAIVIINWYGIRMLMKNKAQRAKVTEGLARLLKDEAVDQYSDGSIYKSYENRYNLFSVVMGSVAVLAVITTVTIFINQLTKL